MGGWFVDLYVAYLFKSMLRIMHALTARHWPITTARVARTTWSAGGLGCPSAELIYLYNLGGAELGGIDQKPFVSPNSAEDYARRFVQGSSVVVRYRRENPAVSIMRDRDQNGRVAQP